MNNFHKNKLSCGLETEWFSKCTYFCLGKLSSLILSKHVKLGGPSQINIIWPGDYIAIHSPLLGSANVPHHASDHGGC